jgi:hypothetical protein
MSATVLLVIIGSLIIAALAVYAVSLLLKLKRQEAIQQRNKDIAIAKRNGNIFENVNALCQAGIQEQCDFSEITIRVYCILDYVQGDDRVDFATAYPAMQELYDVVKDMPRGDARKEIAKKQRMTMDLARVKAESRLQEAIKLELHQLKHWVASLNANNKNTSIDVKMI